MFPSWFMLTRNQQGVEKLLAFLRIMRYYPLLGSTPNAIAGIYDTDDTHCLSSFPPVARGSFEVPFYFWPRVSLVASRMNFRGHQVLSHVEGTFLIISELEKQGIRPRHNQSFLVLLYLCPLYAAEQGGVVWDVAILRSFEVCVLLGFIRRTSLPLYLV